MERSHEGENRRITENMSWCLENGQNYPFHLVEFLECFHANRYLSCIVFILGVVLFAGMHSINYFTKIAIPES